MAYTPEEINQLVFNKEYRDSLDGNFKKAASEFLYLESIINQAKARLNSLIINASGDSNPEVIAARIDTKNVTHATINERFNNIEFTYDDMNALLTLLETDMNRYKSIIRVDSTGDVTLYVDGKTGMDSNDGSQAAPFKTIQRAVDEMPYINAHGGFNIYVADGTYDEDVIVSSRSGLPFTLQGNPDVPSNVKVKSVAFTDLGSYAGVNGIEATTIIGHQFFFNRCKYVSASNIIATANNKDAGFSGVAFTLTNGGCFGVTSSNGVSGIVADVTSQISINTACTGTNNTYGVRSIRSIVHKAGANGLTGATANERTEYGGIISNGGIIG